jgi:hypothetical protein
MAVEVCKHLDGLLHFRIVFFAANLVVARPNPARFVAGRPAVRAPQKQIPAAIS